MGAVDSNIEQQPQSEEFAWLIDECIHQRITVIVTEDRRLLQERVRAIALAKRSDEARREQWQKWLNWTLGNLHRASNRNTFFYLLWTSLVIFYCAIFFMGMPTAVACPQHNGICHNLRIFALYVKEQIIAIPRLLPQSKK